MPDTSSLKFDHLTSSEDVIQLECSFLGLTTQATHGIALSGGGIRSAAFSLGVLQRLAEQDKFNQFQYLSTVSGGGYLGSALTWWLHLFSTYPTGGTSANTSSFAFPFSTDSATTNASPAPKHIVSYLRSHANYLLPSERLGALSLVALVLRNAVASLTIFASLFVVGLIIFLLVYHSILDVAFELYRSLLKGTSPYPSFLSNLEHWTLLPLAVVALFLSLFVIFYALVRIPCSSKLSAARSAILTLFDLVPRLVVFVLSFHVVVSFDLAASLCAFIVTIFGTFSAAAFIPFIWIFLFSSFALFFGSIGFSLYTVFYQYLQGNRTDDMLADLRYRSRVRSQMAFGLVFCIWIMALFASAIAILASIPFDALPLLLATSAVILVAASGSAYIVWSKKSGGIPKHVEYMLTISFCVIILAFSLLIFKLMYWTIGYPLGVCDLNAKGWAYIVIFVTIALVGGLYVNINYLGLHRVYRDRLIELFLPGKESVEGMRWGQAVEANRTMLNDVCVTKVEGEEQEERRSGRLPYHILNANVVLVNSKIRKFRERGGDNFILSPLYCGSSATGWKATKGYLGRYDPGISLGTAMAISGAAANPNAGFSGRSITRNRLVSLVFSLAGLRTGYWAPNPQRDIEWWRPPPNFLFPELTSGVVGGNLHERARFVDLTDGGHFENLGLYELIRRRLTRIVVCDASFDPKFQFESLRRALDLIRFDFGVEVRFDTPGLGLGDLVSTNEGSSADHGKAGLALADYAVARIIYPNKVSKEGQNQHKETRDGELIYLKPTITERVPEELRIMVGESNAFPHDSTANQFFGEMEFEAYRRLGWTLARRAVCEKLGSTNS